MNTDLAHWQIDMPMRKLGFATFQGLADKTISAGDARDIARQTLGFDNTCGNADKRNQFRNFVWGMYRAMEANKAKEC